MGTRKGCYQCNKRRIVCDMAEPRCLKCATKGLECSGNGLRYRFNDGIASRGKFRGYSTPIAQGCPSLAAKRPHPRKQSEENGVQTVPKRRCISKEVARRPISDDRFKVGILPCLELTDGRTRLLLDYFSSHMAPGMVILDGKNNGYRNLILPFAVQDKLVRQAVTSIASLQLAHARSDMRTSAEISRAGVIQQLKQLSTASGADRVFNISSWMTVLVLLVGELARGGDHYSYLLRMMRSIKHHGVVDPNPETVRFLSLQTDLILYLAQPFLGASSDAEMTVSAKTMQSILVESQGQRYSNADLHILQIITEAGQVCYDICKDCDIPEQQDTKSALQHLKTLVSQIPPCTAGGNSMVWVYFIGAAESETMEDYTFFTSCLVDIYNGTGWENIPRGLSMLEQVRQRPPGNSWRHILPQVATAFVM